jgi:hypothetical protein
LISEVFDDLLTEVIVGDRCDERDVEVEPCCGDSLGEALPAWSQLERVRLGGGLVLRKFFGPERRVHHRSAYDDQPSTPLARRTAGSIARDGGRRPRSSHASLEFDQLTRQLVEHLSLDRPPQLSIARRVAWGDVQRLVQPAPVSK